MSGRCRTSSDGKLSGSSPGNVKSSRGERRGDQRPGAWPASTESACSAAASCWRERRELRLVARELRLRGQHVAARDLARLELPLDEIEAALVVRDDVLDRVDLRAQRRDRDRLGDGVPVKVSHAAASS